MTLSFLVAAPRSGTTWLQTMLSELPDVACVESRPYGSFFEMWPNKRNQPQPRQTIDHFSTSMARHLGRPGTLPDDIALELAQAYLAATHEVVRRTTGAAYVVEKITPYVGTSDKVVEAIARNHPGAPVCQLVRDGRDVVTSGVFHWLERSDQALARRKFFVDGELDELTRFFDDDSLRYWCRQWAEPIEAMLNHDLAPGQDGLSTIRYESFLADPVDSLSSLAAGLGLSVAEDHIERAVEECSFERMSGGRKPGDMNPLAHVRSGVVGDWRRYFTRRDGQIFTEETNQLLERLGYAPNRDWVDDLPEQLSIRPDGQR